jgi:hypothetical protein
LWCPRLDRPILPRPAPHTTKSRRYKMKPTLFAKRLTAVITRSVGHEASQAPPKIVVGRGDERSDAGIFGDDYTPVLFNLAK